MRTDTENKLQSKTCPTTIPSTKKPSRTTDRGNKNNSNFILFLFLHTFHTGWMFQSLDRCLGRRSQECLSNLGYVSTQHHTSSMPHYGREGYMFWMSCKVASISSCSTLFFSFSATRSSGNNVGEIQYKHTYCRYQKVKFKMAALIVCASELLWLNSKKEIL